MYTKKSECELKTAEVKCIIQIRKQKQKLSAQSAQSGRQCMPMPGLADDRIAQTQLKNSFSYPYSYCNRGRIRTVLSPLGFGAKAVALLKE